jgi:eukaryotic-like serine/threonine-protein kinase
MGGVITMSESTSGPDLFNVLADEFAERYRRGERPPLCEYTEKYPELAEQIHELFPALVAIEQFATGADQAAGQTAPRPEPAGPIPERLGDYRILREIGRGGMGIVYEAVQESLGRHVALKVLPQFRLHDPNQLERFRREARAAAMLHHTNIVPVFGVGEHNGVHHYAMQYIQGQGLDTVLREVKRLRGFKSDETPPSSIPGDDPGLAASVAMELVSGKFAGESGPVADTELLRTSHSSEPGAHPSTPSRVESSGPSASASSILGQSGSSYYQSVARLAVQAAEALAYAHYHKLLHRDIKPANLLLDLQGTIWITDFGLVKAEGSDALTQTGDVVGTLRYVAPERFRGQGDARSDVYALGLTLYEMLTLEPAFAADQRSLLIDKILHDEPLKPRQIDPRIPSDLETVTLKAIAKDPSDRYRTASEMAEDLRRYLADRPILARRASAMERARRWCRRNPALAASFAAVAAALVAVAVLALLYADRQSTATQRITALADDLKTSLAESNRLLAIRNFDRGRAAFEKGEIGPGLLWTIESWRSAVEAGDLVWQHAARANLAAWRLHYPRLKAVFSHTMPASRAAFSPDGCTVISVSVDGTARLWDPASGKSIGPSMRAGGQYPMFGFSPDGKVVWTCSEDGAAGLWDATTGEPVVLPVRLPPQFHSLANAIQPDGKLMRVVSDVNAANVAWRWDAATRKPIGPPLTHEGHVNSAAFSPDGGIILTCSDDGTVRFWDAVTGQPSGPPLKRPGRFRSAAISHDSKIVLTDLRDGPAQLWDAATGVPTGPPLKSPGGFYNAAFSPDSKTIVTGGLDGTAQLWDATSGQPIGQPMRHDSQVRELAFTPDGKTLLTGSRDSAARLWDVASGTVLVLLEHQGPVFAVAFSPDGKSLVTASLDGTVRLWDAEIYQPVRRVLEQPAAVCGVMFSPDGKTILIDRFDGTARLWDAVSGAPIVPSFEQLSSAGAVAFSPDGKTLYTAGKSRTARLRDAVTARPIGPIFPSQDNVDAVAFSPDGKTLLTGTGDAMIRLFDVTTGTLLGSPLPQPANVIVVRFSPDGRIFLIGDATGTVQLWDVATRTPLGKPFPHPGAFGDVKFSPDGKALLTACEDGAARLWDVETQTLLFPPLRHHGRGHSVAFSPDGKTLLTGGDDKTARLWDAATGMPLGPPLLHPKNVRVVAFSPDGKTILTGGDDGLVRFFSMFLEVPDDLDGVAAWIEVLTGLTLDAQRGSIQVLDNAVWLDRRERLKQLGGPP